MTASILTNRVLVLNRNWNPINVVSAFDAIQDVFTGNALFVDTESYRTFEFEGWIDNWEDAIRASKVAEDRIARSPSVKLVIPDVIVCKEYKGNGFEQKTKKGLPKFSRRNIFIRDKHNCQYCGKKFDSSELNLDHVIPKSRGGQMSWLNIVLSCILCNTKKGDKSLKEAGMRLIRQPRIPKPEDLRRPFSERIRRKIGKDVPKTWETFLGKIYWSIELKDD